MTIKSVLSNKGRALIAQILKSKKIEDSDVQELRLRVFPDGVFNLDQAKILILLDKACTQKSVDWSDYFVTALSDYFLLRSEPIGGVEDKSIDWLKENLTPLGHVQSDNEFKLLKCLLERSVPASPALCAFVLSQLHHVMSDYDPALFISNQRSVNDTSSRSSDFATGSIDVLYKLASSKQPIEFL